MVKVFKYACLKAAIKLNIYTLHNIYRIYYNYLHLNKWDVLNYFH